MAIARGLALFLLLAVQAFAGFGKVVQAKTGTGDGTTISVVLDKTPVEGNALVAVHSADAAPSLGITSAGWGSPSVTLTNATETDETTVTVKIAGSSESTTITAEASGSDPNMLIVLEIEGPFASSSQVDLAYAGSRATGSTYAISAGTPSQAMEMAIAFVAHPSNTSPASTTWSNGFHQFGLFCRSTALAPWYEHSLSVAFRDVQSTSSLSTTATFSGSVVAMGGMITLKAATSVTTPPTAGDGYWYERARPADGRALEDVNPDPGGTADYKGSNGQSAIIDAWGGAAIRQTGSTIEYVLEANGGHGNYYGNEGYTLDITDTSAGWVRHRNPTETTADLELNDTDGEDALGNALSRHVYCTSVWDSIPDRFYYFGGAFIAGLSGTSTSTVSYLDYGTNKTTWTHGAYTNKPAGGGSATRWHAHPLGGGEFAIIDAQADKFHRFTEATDTYTQYNVLNYVGNTPNQGASLYDSKRGRVVIFGYNASLVMLVNPFIGGNITQTVTSIPDSLLFSNDSRIGGVYDTYLDKYVFWDGGEKLFDLDPVTWAFSTRSLSAQSVIPTMPANEGTMDRFAYVKPTAQYPEGAYVVVNGVDESTYFFTTAAADAPPEITADPENATVTAPATAEFSCTESGGSPAPDWQWQLDSGAGWGDISGATSSTYTTPSTSLSDDGNQYRCIATNTEGADTSTAATLTVQTVPVVTDDPDNATVTEPATAQFTVTATGSPAVSYQWQKDGTNVVDGTGGTTATYTTAATTDADDGAEFRCIVTNAAGADTSAAATLTVHFLPEVTNPSNETVTVPASAGFSSTVTGNPAPTLQWQRNGVNIGGATSNSYTLDPTAFADNGATFRIIATNSVGADTSAAATLTANDQPRVTSNPSSVTRNPDQAAGFAAAFAGTATITLQWQSDDGGGWGNISGATSNSYTTDPVALEDSGTVFRCIATNAYGSDTTSAATLHVTEAVLDSPRSWKVRRRLGIGR